MEEGENSQRRSQLRGCVNKLSTDYHLIYVKLSGHLLLSRSCPRLFCGRDLVSKGLSFD